MKKILLATFLSLMATVVLALIYLKIYIPSKSSDFSWLAEWRDLCYSNSLVHPETKISRDYLQILDGKYDGKTYSGYLDNKCVDNSKTGSCLDVPLIVSVAFVLRGNEKDFDLSKKTLDHYKNSAGRNIYYDFGQLRVLSRPGYEEFSDIKSIKKYLSDFSKLEHKDSYFQKFYTKFECEEAVKNTALIYSRYIDFNSGVYIRTQLTN